MVVLPAAPRAREHPPLRIGPVRAPRGLCDHRLLRQRHHTARCACAFSLSLSLPPSLSLSPVARALSLSFQSLSAGGGEGDAPWVEEVLAGGRKGDKLFCATHKREGQVNVRRKLCEREGCKKYANFCDDTTMQRRMCAKHKVRLRLLSLRTCSV